MGSGEGPSSAYDHPIFRLYDEWKGRKSTWHRQIYRIPAKFVIARDIQHFVTANIS
jgi:hypothetical protein